MARQYMEQAAATGAATGSAAATVDPALAALSQRLKLDLAAAQHSRTLEHQRGEAYKDEYYQERSAASECNQQWLTAVQNEEYWENYANEYYDRAEALASELATAATAPHGLRRDTPAGSERGGRAPAVHRHRLVPVGVADHPTLMVEAALQEPASAAAAERDHLPPPAAMACPLHAQERELGAPSDPLQTRTATASQAVSVASPTKSRYHLFPRYPT